MNTFFFLLMNLLWMYFILILRSINATFSGGRSALLAGAAASEIVTSAPLIFTTFLLRKAYKRISEFELTRSLAPLIPSHYLKVWLTHGNNGTTIPQLDLTNKHFGFLLEVVEYYVNVGWCILESQEVVGRLVHMMNQNLD